jgi:glycosyltransferase involved in cell wall biosynthesis
MKICFIQPRAYELFQPAVQTQFGGAEVQMYLHAKELAKHPEHQVSFMVADYGQAKKETYDNVQVYKSINFRHSLFRQIVAFYKTFRIIDPDIYLQMTLTRFSFIIALWCLLTGKKFVYLISHDHDLNGKILKTNFILQKLSLLVFIFSHKIIAQNKYQYELLKKYHIHSEIIRSSLEAAPQTANEKEYHLWIARAEVWKRPELFIQLAECYPDEKFLMVCPPFSEVDTDYFTSLMQHSSRLKNLVFIDHYIHFSELDNLFSKSKLFINTSESEGFPTTFIHACKNGIPVLSLSVNPDNIFETHGIGFYCHDKMEELKARMEEICRDEELYKTTVQNCLRYFDTHHHLSVNSAALIKYITA